MCEIGFQPRPLLNRAVFWTPAPAPRPLPEAAPARGSRITLDDPSSSIPATSSPSWNDIHADGMTYTPIQLDGSRTTDRELDGSQIVSSMARGSPPGQTDRVYRFSVFR